MDKTFKQFGVWDTASVTLEHATRDRSELDQVLRGMLEGVLAVDQAQRLISMNPAAAHLLELDPATAMGRRVQEVVRNDALRAIINESMGDGRAVTRDLALKLHDGRRGEEERFLKVQTAALHDALETRIGTMIVLHDVTRLRRLEVVRRDFVANVSHEIKTPVTAIKAAVEMLLDMDSFERAQSGQQFMEVIARQADRLHAIVEDLLSLARIEQDEEHQTIVLERCSMTDVLHAAVETCRVQANHKQIAIESSCPAGLRISINRLLIEQAVVNLIDNAIKYSNENTTVKLTCHREGQEVLLQVADQGYGISQEHLPRIFERFYRTDKARSRSMGGTGLGLAIVKHIAQAHGGRISVDSTVGVGSVFRIHLPVR